MPASLDLFSLYIVDSMPSPRQCSGSSTAVIELEPVHLVHHGVSEPAKQSSSPVARSLRRNDTDDSQDANDRNESLPSPTTASQEIVERWNYSKMNIARTFAAFWGFVVMGMNDATYGVSTPESGTIARRESKC